MLSFSIARRFIRHNRSQSTLIIIGIAIGITAQLFVGMLIDSLQASLINQTLGTTPHISVQTDGVKLDNTSTLLTALASEKSITSVLPVAESNGFLKEDSKNYPILFRGLTSVAQDKLYTFSSHLTSGSFPKNESEILIGKDLAEKAKLETGNSLTLQNPLGRTFNYTVSGIYDLKVEAVNQLWIIGTLPAGQQFGGMGNTLTGIELQTSDPFKADTVMSNEINHYFSNQSGVNVTNWKLQNASLLSGLQGQSSSSYMIQLFVLLSVLVGITSVLSISVMQQSRQIGILKAMGLPDSMAGKIFSWQGLILGFWGTLIGGVLGFGAFYGFALNVKNPDGSPLIAPVVNWPFVWLTLGIALLVAIFAGLIPARKSRRLNPIDIIRSN